MATRHAFNLATFVLTALVTVSVGSVQAAEVARFAYGRGHLAARSADAEWQGLRLGDEIPASSHLRTSPAAPVRIELPAAVLSLAPEADLDLNLADNQIMLHRGRLLLRNLGEQVIWTVMAGTSKFACAPGSEVEVSFDETIGTNVLKGRVQVTQPTREGVELTAPLEWVGNQQGGSKSSVPTASDWVTTIQHRTEPKEEQGVGQLLAKDAQSDSPIRLDVARYHVNVVLQPPVALVQIDESFFNPYNNQQEGTFVFNLPDGASVSRFAMFVTHDQLIEGELIDRQKADQVYSSIVRTKRDPAILEQIGTNLFRMRVFPVTARDTKRILLDYTIPLVSDRGRYRFELPLMSDLKPIWDFGITGVIHPPFAPGSISSASHPDLEFVNAENGSVTFSKRAKDVQPPQSLLVDFSRVANDRQPTVRSFNSDERHQHFVMTIPESANPVSKKAKRATDLLVLVDTSQHSSDLAQARLAARVLVDNMDPQDRWQLGCVDVSYRPVTSDWMTPRSILSRAAIRQLDELFPLGESRLDATLEDSLQTFAKSTEDRRRVIVYLGSGRSRPMEPSRWPFESIRENSPTRPEFHAVKLGNEKIVENWMRAGTRTLNGRVFDLQNSTTGLRELFEWTLDGMPLPTTIESCEIDGVPKDDLFFDPQWLAGSELHLSGRCPPTNSLALKLKLAGQPEQIVQAIVEAKNGDDDVFTGRTWARHKLDSLLASSSVRDQQQTDAIVRLCQEWSLMSPFTAFLVLETEQDYTRWNIPRQLRHRYWKPSGTIDALPLLEHLKQHDSEVANRVAEAKQKAIVNAFLPVRPISPIPANANAAENDQQQMKKHFEAAKEALANNNPMAAKAHLSAAREFLGLFDTAEFDSLMGETKRGLRREFAFEELKTWKSLVDRRVGSPLKPIAPLLLSFSSGGSSREYFENHPLAMNFLRPAPKFDEPTVSLEDFATAMQSEACVPIVIDISLAEAGISKETLVEMTGAHEITVKSLMNLVLDRLALTVVSERFCLRIMTQEAADSRMSSRVYPVADLLHSNVLPQPERLLDPMVSDSIEWKRTLERKLNSPISVQFADFTLKDAIDYLSAEVGIEFWIDGLALKENDISIEQKVSVSAEKWPAELVLHELLDPLYLTYVIRDGAFVLTTREKADEFMETRVYSAAGIIDESAPNPLVEIRGSRAFHPYFGHQLGGGMGMGGMGGMGGGMSGGIFARTVAGSGPEVSPDVAMGGGDPAGKSNAWIGEISPPQIDVPEPQIGAMTSQETIAQFDWTTSIQVAPKQYLDASRLIMSTTPGKWLDQDGEGGTISFHQPSFTFVIRQNQHVHSQVRRLFAKLRRQPRTFQFGEFLQSRRRNLDVASDSEYQRLMQIVALATPGKWLSYDGEGGTMAPHSRTESLVIYQTARVHEEVEPLFVQLRRARYVTENLPWMTSLEGIDDVGSLFDLPSITNLPRNNLPTTSDNGDRADSLQQLAVRKPMVTMNQHWQHTSTITGQRRDIVVRRSDARLELRLFDRTMRADGPRAAVAYPRLSLVEIDDWGDAVRQVADASIPWLAHRSNEELSQLFEVTTVSKNEFETTLRLGFPGDTETYLKSTFANQTGVPVRWQSYRTDQLQYELRISPKMIIAVDAKGAELERWELKDSESSGPLLAVTEGWNDFVVVEPSDADSPLVKARDALRRGDIDKATNAFATLLTQHPKQPLLNFLYAWSVECSRNDDPSLRRSQREALERLTETGSSDLLSLVTPNCFGSIGTKGLREIFLKNPEEKRTADDWDKLAEFAINLKRFEVALNELERSISVTTEKAKQIERQIRRVDLLLKNGRPAEAEVAGLSLVASGLSPAQLIQLGNMIGREETLSNANVFFDHYRRTVKLTDRELEDLAYHQASLIKKGEFRWRQFLVADPNRTENRNVYTKTIVMEADEPRDAEVLGKLASELRPGLVQAGLFLRQAELTLEPREAADIVWKLYQENRLPESRLRWASDLFERLERWKEVVEILEQHLRKTGKINGDLLPKLANSYDKLGRESDAIRARTQGTSRDRDNEWRTRRPTGTGFF